MNEHNKSNPMLFWKPEKYSERLGLNLSSSYLLSYLLDVVQYFERWLHEGSDAYCAFPSIMIIYI